MSSFDEIPAASRGTSPTPGIMRPANAGGRNRAGRAVQQDLLLPAADPGPAVSPVAAPRRLWLCLYLPMLPLEALVPETADRYAVFEEQQGIRRVLMANRPARAAGVMPGLSLNAALSLCPQLALGERDPAQEARLVQRLAAWASRFTSFVVVEADDLLLLEIAGSLNLFGGIERIRREIRHGLDARGLTGVMAAAPTPLASIWLARAGRHEPSPPELSQLAGILGEVPLEHVDWPRSIIDRMRGMGVTRIGDCLRLPRQGFARRFGINRLNELDRALGRLPDPREHYRMPERFSADLEFDTELDDSEQILAGCRDLLLRLERFLRSRQLQVQRIQVSFFHLRDDATHLAFGCMQAGQGVEHWFELLRIRFERVVLPSPVIAVRLRGGQGEPASMSTSRLLDSRRQELPIERLVERLSARMGDGVVHGVATVAEHRPQHAWRRTAPMEMASHCAAPARFWNERDMPGLPEDARRTHGLLLRRPLWVLDEPESLPVHDGRPLYRGCALDLEGPERLETGWWDDDGIARDYYVARNPAGVYLWVYRDRADGGGWYLHGMFG